MCSQDMQEWVNMLRESIKLSAKCTKYLLFDQEKNWNVRQICDICASHIPCMSTLCTCRNTITHVARAENMHNMCCISNIFHWLIKDLFKNKIILVCCTLCSFEFLHFEGMQSGGNACSLSCGRCRDHWKSIISTERQGRQVFVVEVWRQNDQRNIENKTMITSIFFWGQGVTKKCHKSSLVVSI